MRKIIRVDGTEVEIPSRERMDKLRAMIGADTLDTVLLRDRVHVMLLSDTGAIDGSPVNLAATKLYHDVCHPGTTHQIHGDVVIVPDEDFA
jgi:hypothetical protein